jgi:hypothetical protein
LLIAGRFLKRAGGVAHVVSCLPSKCEAQSSNTNTTKKTEKYQVRLYVCIYYTFLIHLTSEDFLPNNKYVAVISSYFILLRDS